MPRIRRAARLGHGLDHLEEGYAEERVETGGNQQE